MKSLIVLALVAWVSSLHAAQIYEWVDEKGVKQFTQQPPPPNIKQVLERRVSGNVIETSGPSFSLQLATKKYPVTLYVTDCGDLCKDAKAHLSKRGIPYTEKNPQKPEDIDSFRKLSGGGMEIPLLVVGDLKTIKGYQSSEWDSTLDAAGYPSTATPGFKPPAKAPAK